MLMVNQLDEEVLKRNKATFQAIDVDHSGWISIDELKSAFKTIHTSGSFTDESVENIMRNVDLDHNGEINYSEFLSVTLDKKQLKEENIRALFKVLDINNQDYLTKESLHKTF
jgi:Ca2+-binding EF-hand superfamily protein